MAKIAAVGLDIAAVGEHLARYVVSCPLCKGVSQLGVEHEECKIISGADAKDGISVRRRPLQALRLPLGRADPPQKAGGQAEDQSRLTSEQEGRPPKDGRPRNRLGRLLHAARIALEPFLGPGTRVDELRRAEALPGLGGPEFAPQLIDHLREAGELGRPLRI